MKHMKKIKKVMVSCLLGVLLALTAGCPNPANNDSSDFVPVTDITGVPSGGVKDAAIDLSKATVSPANAANKTISWAVAEDSADRGVLDGASLTPTQAGTLTLRGTVKNGLGEKADYTKDFTLTIAAGHVPVTDITGVPSGGVKGAAIDLSKAIVYPADASNKTIEWSVKDPGRTALPRGLVDSIFTPDNAGTAVITGAVKNGKAEGDDFTKDFTLTIAASHVPVRDITGVPGTAVPGAVIDLSGVRVDPEDATDTAIVWSVATDSAIQASINGALITPESAGILKVSARIAQGKSGSEPYTQTFSITVSPPAQSAPAAPAAPSLAGGDRRITVTWSAVESAGAYEVWYGTASNSAAATRFGGDVSGTSTVITGLTNLQTYYVWIKGKNSAGTSGFSPSASATPAAGGTPEPQPQPPAAPAAPSLSAGDRHITVTWSAVESAGAYEVWYGTASDAAAATRFGGDVSGTSAVITGLTNLQTYYVWIKGKNSAGTSGFSPSAAAIPHEPGIIPIGSAEDLAQIGSEGFPMDGVYTLLGDIELNEWHPIGAVSNPFAGTFNGNGRTITITGFHPDAMSRNVYLGIFAYVKGSSAKAVIKDLTINSQIDSIGTNAGFALAVGLVAGYAENTEISNITLQGSFTFKARKSVVVGGAAGYLQDGAILRNVTGNMSILIDGGGGDSIFGFPYYNYVGGFVGAFDSRNGTGAIIENCHNTGPVSAHCTTTDSQVFLGGITGGSYYGFSITYKGYIQDCSSTGDITGYAKHFWTFAGGIAGAMTGGTSEDGNIENDTRIVRCRASGTINALDTDSPFPYAGGIVGYNYFGAVVSQCSFSGTVLGWDYTGGIAGYNSKELNGHSSRIEDCRSEGQVIGAHIAGGIVGQNQVCATVKRCYSTAVISTTEGGTGAGGSSGQGGINGEGGIAGFNHGSLGGEGVYPTVSGCFALNTSISAAGNSNRIHRITGYTEYWDETRPHNNYARSGLTPSGLGYAEDKGRDRPDGEDCDERPAQALYQEAGWDFSAVWKMGGDGLPRLKWE